VAKLLFRIGHFSARRPILVVLAWVLAVLGLGAAMSALQKPLDNTFTLPGSEFGRVFDHLGRTIPAAAGGSGTAVIHAEKPFTKDQRAAIDKTFTDWEELAIVKEIIDPFAAQEELDQSQVKLREGRAQLDKGQEQFDDGQYQLNQLRWLIKQGQRDIKKIKATNPSDPTLASRIAGQKQLEKALVDGQAKLDEAEQKLNDGWRQYAAGQELAGMTKGMRMVSKDGRTALIQLRFHKGTNEIEPKLMAAVPRVGDQLQDHGLEIEYGQEITYNNQMGGVGEVLGLVVAATVLLFMFGSFLLAGLPLASAFVSVAVALMGAMAASHWISLQQMAPVLGAMLGLAVGIDYSLFIVNRHRRTLIHAVDDSGQPPSRDAVRHNIAMAMGTAGSAVAVAGATVIISLAALGIAGIPSLNQMGALAAITVSMAVLVSLTLTPALLSLVGLRVLPRSVRRSIKQGADPAAAAPKRRRTESTSGAGDHRIASAWVNFVTKRAALVLVAGVALLGVMAIPAAQLQLGLPDGGNEPPSSSAYKSYVMIDKAFGAGANGPIIVVADFPTPVAEADQSIRKAEIGREIKAIPGAEQVVPIGVSKDQKTMAFQVVSAAGPSSKETITLVHGIRDGVKKTFAKQDIEIGVTGATVANIEISDTLARALIPYLGLVMGLSLLLLTIVFRSLVVPVLATLGFLLSVAASFGVIVAVYQWGWLSSVFDVHRTGPVFSFMPTLLIGILFGLAMDYQMFLVSGMHEAYAHGANALDSIKRGFTHSARVVFAAGLIMVSVFGGFIYTPMTMSRPIALGLAIGVLVDAFVVRLTLTPAAMKLLGEKAWWLPAWLGRILPHVDVEGAGLVEQDLAVK
jgi:RND superfamily putative drug exporter